MNGANEGLGATNQDSKEPYMADVTSYGQFTSLAWRQKGLSVYLKQ